MKHSSEKKLTIATAYKPPNALIIIGDTGAGIPEKDLDRIFDPFFTTKSRNGGNTLSDEPTGSGLGLYSCRQLMREYNADISVKSKLGAGTTFTISIPDSNFYSK